jgi:hypothetical protein
MHAPRSFGHKMVIVASQEKKKIRVVNLGHFPHPGMTEAEMQLDLARR